MATANSGSEPSENEANEANEVIYRVTEDEAFDILGAMGMRTLMTVDEEDDQLAHKLEDQYDAQVEDEESAGENGEAGR